MKIPKSLKIGNAQYSVGKLADNYEHTWGRSDSKGQWIKLDEHLSKERAEETLLHEVIHQILDVNDYHDLSDNESFVSCLSNNLYQVLSENGLLKDE